MAEDSNLPLSEMLRPTRLDELVLPERIIEGLQRMYDRQAPDNMLLFGPPGMGKSSTGQIFINQRGPYGVMIVDGSNDTGIENIRSVIEGFASCYAFTPGIKTCMIDDADFLSHPAQAAMRGIIERSSENCRFIFTVNDVTKIQSAIRSRLLCINYSIPESERPGVLVLVQMNVARRLVQLGWSFDPQRLNQIVAENLSDMRRMANKIQFEFRE